MCDKCCMDCYKIDICGGRCNFECNKCIYREEKK